MLPAAPAPPSPKLIAAAACCCCTASEVAGLTPFIPFGIAPVRLSLLRSSSFVIRLLPLLPGGIDIWYSTVASADKSSKPGARFAQPKRGYGCPRTFLTTPSNDLAPTAKLSTAFFFYLYVHVKPEFHSDSQPRANAPGCCFSRSWPVVVTATSAPSTAATTSSTSAATRAAGIRLGTGVGAFKSAS